MEKTDETYGVGTQFWHGVYRIKYVDGAETEIMGRVELFIDDEKKVHLRLFNGGSEEIFPVYGKNFSIYTNGGKKPFYVNSSTPAPAPTSKRNKKK